jgi:hypothetical protein
VLLSHIAGALKARIPIGGERAAATEVHRVVVASTMSELLGLVGPGVLPITDLDSAQLVRAMHLLDVECLGVVADRPSEQMVAAASRAGLVLLALAQEITAVARVAQQLGLPCLERVGTGP